MALGFFNYQRTPTTDCGWRHDLSHHTFERLIFFSVLENDMSDKIYGYFIYIKAIGGIVKNFVGLNRKLVLFQQLCLLSHTLRTVCARREFVEIVLVFVVIIKYRVVITKNIHVSLQP